MAFEATSITGSLFGTASWSQTASRADNIVVTQFNPFSGTGSITGSLNINLAPVSPDDFVYGVFTGDASLGASSDLTFTGTYRTSGSLVSVASNQITLAPNSTYLIKFNLGSSKIWSSSTGNATITVVNTSNVAVGTQATSAILSPYPTSGLFEYMPYGMCLLQVTTPQTIKFRVTAGTGTFQLFPNANSFIIEKIL